ncbi:class I SAM-dependent RNA methyltransferase, partial [Mycobacterium palustre]|uniref:class I SAM-dependent RNA methyltransferase n=1 Tax=Mycobacterium palustre TaxID=153971 RepID=UPI0021F2B757
MTAELTLRTGAPANGGSCVAHHEGRVVFVRYALPGERVRARVTADRGSYWHAEVLEVVEPSDHRVAPLCPIAGVGGAGCCDLAFAAPAAVRALKGEVVANQLQRLGGYRWSGEADPLSDGGPTGWRTRVRLDVGADGRPGFHRYHSDELVTDLRCAQLPAGMLDGLAHDSSGADWPPGAQLHVAVDDDGARHVVRTLRRGNRTVTAVVEGGYEAVQRVGARSWRVPVTAFWQAHRDAAPVYSGLVADWAQAEAGMTVWDLYGGAGVFAAALAEAVGESGRVLSVDTSRASTRASTRA